MNPPHDHNTFFIFPFALTSEALIHQCFWTFECNFRSPDCFAWRTVIGHANDIIFLSFSSKSALTPVLQGVKSTLYSYLSIFLRGENLMELRGPDHFETSSGRKEISLIFHIDTDKKVTFQKNDGS